jgi:hypothetical protein
MPKYSGKVSGLGMASGLNKNLTIYNEIYLPV